MKNQLSYIPETQANSRKKFSIVFVTFFFVAVAPIFLMGCAATVSLPTWARSEADFPARVKAIVFGNLVLSVEQGVRWGQWHVSFASTPPTATRGENPFSGITMITIGKFSCYNSVSGYKEGSFWFYFGDWGQNCYLSIIDSNISITILCPIDVQFER